MRHTSSHRDTYLEIHKLHTNTVEYACEHFPKSTYVAEKVPPESRSSWAVMGTSCFGMFACWERLLEVWQPSIVQLSQRSVESMADKSRKLAINTYCGTEIARGRHQRPGRTATATVEYPEEQSATYHHVLRSLLRQIFEDHFIPFIKLYTTAPVPATGFRSSRQNWEPLHGPIGSVVYSSQRYDLGCLRLLVYRPPRSVVFIGTIIIYPISFFPATIDLW